jgi:crossover junction endodeoxyribonuclease RusA
MYTPKRTRVYEKNVGKYAAFAGCPTFSGLVAVEINSYWSNKVYGDLDNVQKAILDGLNRVAWPDDEQVAQTHIRRILGATRSYSTVKISEIGSDRAFEFEIPERPHPKGRPRAAGGNGVVFTPTKTIEYEKRVADYARQQGAPHFGDDATLCVRILAHHSSHKYGDLDNVQKAILDGLNGTLWGDDKQVGEIYSRRILGAPKPFSIVSVTAIEQPYADPLFTSV